MSESVSAAGAAAPALPARWRLLTILTASYGAGAFGMLGISPLSPSLMEGLDLTRLQVAFLVLAWGQVLHSDISTQRDVGM